MAVIKSNDYDHIDIVNGSNTNRHMLKDAEARAGVGGLRSSVSTVKHAIGQNGQLTLNDAMNELAQKMTIKLKPKQDFHGYDKPWAGGAGKNKLRMILSEVKAANSTWTWNGNSAQKNGITVNVETDSDDNIIGYNAAGTASANVWFVFRSFDAGELPVDGSLKFGGYLSSPGNVSSTYGYQLYFKNNNGQNIISVASSGYNSIYNSVSTGNTNPHYASIVFRSDTSITKLVFKPMVLLATETDTTYEPYSNICHIEGFDSVQINSVGKNFIGSGEEYWEDGSISAAGNNMTTDNSIRTKNFYDVIGGVSYVLSTSVEVHEAWVSRYFKDGTSDRVPVWTTGGHTGTVTLPSNIKTIRVRLADATGNRPDKSISVQLEIKQTGATNFEQYHGNIVSINLASSAGSTVYGGTVTVNEDGSGTLVVDTEYEDFGDMTWEYNGDGRFKGAPKTYVKDHYTANARTVDFCCSCYKVVSDGSPYDATLNGIIYYTATLIWVQDNRYTDAAQYKTAMTGQKIAYPIDAPRTYSLTATQLQTLVGENHIWTDGTNIELDYRAEKYADLDKLFAALPKNTVIGNPVSFTDGADGLPMDKLTVAIDPKQDLHGYDIPWVGGAGKNLCPVNTITGREAISDVICNIPAGSYVISYTSPDTHQLSIRFFHTRGNNNDSTVVIARQGSGSTATLSKAAVSMNVIISPVDSDTITINNIQIEAGSTATSFEPYSNVCPIEAWDEVKVTRTGKNLLFQDGLDWQHNKNLTVDNGAEGTLPGAAYNKQFIRVSPSTTYTWQALIGNEGLTSIVATYYDENERYAGRQTILVASSFVKNAINSASFTTPSNCHKLRICIPDPSSALRSNNNMIERGSTATAYEPYKGQTLPVSMKSVAGSSVYGGTLTVNQDGTGTLEIDRASLVINGSEGFNGDLTINNRAYGYVGDNRIKQGLNSILACDSGIIATDHGSSSIKGIGVSGRSTTKGLTISMPLDILGIDSTANSSAVVTAITNYLSLHPIRVVYMLASPEIYDLSANQLTTLLGANHVSCDTGEMTVNYNADITTFIANMIAQALNSLGGVIHE